MAAGAGDHLMLARLGLGGEAAAEDAGSATAITHESPVNGLVFADGVLVTVAGKTATLWDTDEVLMKATLAHDAPVNAACVSIDGTQLATGGNDQKVSIWSLSTCERVKEMELGGWVKALAFSNDGSTLAAGGAGDSVQLFALPGYEAKTDLKHEGTVNAVRIHDSAECHPCTRTSRATLLDLAPLTPPPTPCPPPPPSTPPPPAAPPPAPQLAFSQDSRLLATAGMDRIVRVWDVSTGACHHELRHDDYVLSVAFAPSTPSKAREDASSHASAPPVLAAGGGDKSVSVWDAASGEMRTQLARESTLYSIAFSPTGELLATGGADKKIALWSRSGRMLAEESCDNSVKALAFSANGRQLAYACGKEARLCTVAVDGAGDARLKPHMNKEQARAVNLPLLRATKEGDLDAVDTLLASGVVDVNFDNQHGDTPLILACWYGHRYITSRLLEHGAFVDTPNCDGNTALNVAAYRGNAEAVQMLVRSRATVDVPDQMTGKTALVKAAYVGHAPCASVLLEAGADVDHADAQGYTALAFATSFNHEYMIQARHPPSPPPPLPPRPEPPGGAQVLLHNDANPNCKDTFGITPLIHAAARGRFDTVQTLLQAGARPMLVDSEGKTALDYAESAGFTDIVDELMDAAKLEPSSAASAANGAPATPRVSYDPTTPRMTPRVPSSVEVGRMTPRVPSSHGAGDATARRLAAEAHHANGNGTSRKPSAPMVITKKQLTPLTSESLSYLAKKLVHLSVMLEQDTVSDDTRYPSFHR